MHSVSEYRGKKGSLSVEGLFAAVAHKFSVAPCIVILLLSVLRTFFSSSKIINSDTIASVGGLLSVHPCAKNAGARVSLRV